MVVNPYVLAADNPTALIALLIENSSLAINQDEHGYSLLHAAASYNHLDLMRRLVREFRVPVDLRDKDGETPLFYVETVEAARVLVEELGLNKDIVNDEGLAASKKIKIEGDYPAVAEFLERATAATQEPVEEGTANKVNGVTGGYELPPLPKGLLLRLGTIDELDLGQDGPEVQQVQTILQQFAERHEADITEVQAELRQLVEDAIAGMCQDGKVRPRQG